MIIILIIITNTILIVITFPLNLNRIKFCPGIVELIFSRLLRLYLIKKSLLVQCSYESKNVKV